MTSKEKSESSLSDLDLFFAVRAGLPRGVLTIALGPKVEDKDPPQRVAGVTHSQSTHRSGEDKPKWLRMII